MADSAAERAYRMAVWFFPQANHPGSVRRQEVTRQAAIEIRAAAEAATKEAMERCAGLVEALRVQSSGGVDTRTIHQNAALTAAAAAIRGAE